MSRVSASHHLAWPGCWLLLSGCLLSPPSCPSRPADPEVWFGEAVLEGGVQLRLGGYVVDGGGLKPIFEWATDESETAARRLFEPFGRAGHGNFVHALQHEAGVVLLAAHEQRETLGVVVLGPTGEVQSAHEIQLEAPPFHFRVVSTQDGEGFVLGLSMKGQQAGLLWFDPQAELIRSMILPGLSGVTDLVLHSDRSLSVLGPAVMGSDPSGHAALSRGGIAELAELDGDRSVSFALANADDPTPRSQLDEAARAEDEFETLPLE